MSISCIFVFFFQAEDGIRDLVRSRGLGDVYKRQVLRSSLLEILRSDYIKLARAKGTSELTAVMKHASVSYTHLTLPTSDLV